jgi:gamma-glutamyl:cysteine ligase YbdK (ATP-grasp superfamily)
MGKDIDRDTFEESDYAHFRERLDACLAVLAEVIKRPGFGTGPATVGAELELVLVDGQCRPLPRNEAVRAAATDSRVTVELASFNLELNSSPVLLAGRPFAALGTELDLLLCLVAEAAAGYGGRVAAIGILPTISSADLSHAMLTDLPRYRALGNGLRRLRKDPFHIQITGADPLDLVSEDIAPEGANTSFQVHLRVEPAGFSRVYNAIQLATAPALAVAGNSPTFLGHRLWEETRVALFKQSVEDRRAGPRRQQARTSLGNGWLRGGAVELFTRSVRMHQPLLPVLAGPEPPTAGIAGQAPALDELRLHQGTVWPWNRAIYDPAEGGHLRVEMRALPAGPTVIDMMANAAYLIGLSLWLADQDERWTYALPFERADHNFYRAAQQGLSAVLTWPAWRPDQTRTIAAADLVAESLPNARQGLLKAGVAATEADRLLEIIAARASSGQTGAVWQRAALAAARARLHPESALAEMLQRYLDSAATGQPVHLWPTNE